LRPQFAGLLLSLTHGFFVWHPVYLLCAAGFFLRWPGAHARGVLSVAGGVLLLERYLNASVSDWWAGNAFGARRFVDFLPLFHLGLIGLAARARRLAPATVLAVLLMVGNVPFCIQYRFGYVPRGQAVTMRMLVLDRLLLPWFERWY
jgi:hypothetical protein